MRKRCTFWNICNKLYQSTVNQMFYYHVAACQPNSHITPVSDERLLGYRKINVFHHKSCTYFGACMIFQSNSDEFVGRLMFAANQSIQGWAKSGWLKALWLILCKWTHTLIEREHTKSIINHTLTDRWAPTQNAFGWNEMCFCLRTSFNCFNCAFGASLCSSALAADD